MSLDRKRTSPTESGRRRSPVWEHSGADILKSPGEWGRRFVRKHTLRAFKRPREFPQPFGNSGGTADMIRPGTRFRSGAFSVRQHSVRRLPRLLPVYGKSPGMRETVWR